MKHDTDQITATSGIVAVPIPLQLDSLLNLLADRTLANG